MRDRSRIPEQPRGQAVEVDGVVVARHGGVPASKVARQLPFRGDGQVLTARYRWLAVAPAARAASQVRARLIPDELTAHPRFRDHGELPALGVWLEPPARDAQRESLARSQRSVLCDAVLDVTSPIAGNGKRWSVISAMCMGKARA